MPRTCRLNCGKCELFLRKVSFSGHIISGDGIKVQPEKTEAVRCWPEPNNLTELRSFLGLASYYCRFICEFSVVTFPLYNLMSYWDVEQQDASDKLKTALTNAPVLGSTRSEGTFYLDTDASDLGLSLDLELYCPRSKMVKKECWRMFCKCCQPLNESTA